MQRILQEKLSNLKTTLKQLHRVAVAYSGGVDSTFLITVAYEILGSDVVAITVVSPMYTPQECLQAQKYAKTLGIQHIMIKNDILKNKHVVNNSKNRCYYCKRDLFKKIQEVARKNNISTVLDGSNADDHFDYRPGQKALDELGVLSPLRDVGLTKQEIRQLSKQYHLTTWALPADACLASRFPYGVQITKRRLQQVYRAETYLKQLGLTIVRVRYHEDIARIEVEQKDFPIILRNAADISNYFKRIGFHYSTLDIQGYRRGSMNEVLENDEKTIA
ncbi:MAG: ATP-dependent sacrificial sulfur transferase LarE [Candidatus Thermoplasmatota archaeon]